MSNNSRKKGKTSRREMLKVVSQVSQTIADELDMELVDLEYIKEFGNYFLRVYIEKIGGVSTDDCERMSKRLSIVLDEIDPIEESYYLEVSSPGLDRPLKTDKDFKRNIGKDVEIKLYKSLNDKKNYKGKLVDYDDTKITVENKQGDTISLARELVSIVKLVINF